MRVYIIWKTRPIVGQPSRETCGIAAILKTKEEADLWLKKNSEKIEAKYGLAIQEWIIDEVENG